MWNVNRVEGTAVGPSEVVAVGGNLYAVLGALWDDESGVRVSVDLPTDDLSADDARALADALRRMADTPPPE